jgi:hypothetical protein
MNAADALGLRCADAMWKDDAASSGPGMRLEHIEAGRALG